jgi:hypothetical protein
LMKVQQFSTAVFEERDEDHIVQNVVHQWCEKKFKIQIEFKDFDTS